MEILSTGCTVVLELNRLICDIASSSGNRIRGILHSRLFSICWSYCEKIDSDVVVEVMSMSSVIEISSITPAVREVISNCHGSPAVVTEKVVAESEISPLGVTFVPDHDEYAPPITSVSIVRSMVVVVVVVACILPCVKLGTTL